MADATAVWNRFHATYEFPTAPVADNNATFADVWNAQSSHVITLSGAIAGITADVNSALGASAPPPTSGDLFNYTIQNWG